MIEDVYETEYAQFSLKNGILSCLYKSEEVDIQIGKAIVVARMSYVDGVSYPTLIDYTHVKSTTKEARDYFSTDEAGENITAMAVVINSLVGKTMLNFYMKISKPKFPIRIFNDRESGIDWLNQFK